MLLSIGTMGALTLISLESDYCNSVAASGRYSVTIVFRSLVPGLELGASHWPVRHCVQSSLLAPVFL